MAEQQISPETEHKLTLLPFDTRSVMEWPGLHSGKWKKGRAHLRVVGEFEKADMSTLPVIGKKHFPPQQTKIKKDVPCMKMFPNWTSKGMEFDKGNKLNYVPPLRKYLPEKLLFSMKAGEVQKKKLTKKELYRLKKKGLTIEEAFRQGASGTAQNASTAASKEGRYTWKEKEMMEALNEDVKSVGELFPWETKVLKRETAD